MEIFGYGLIDLTEEFEFYSKKHFYVKEIQYFYKTGNKYIYLGKADKIEYQGKK